MAKEASHTDALHALDAGEQGLIATGNDRVALAKAIELAVDYRGDVRITRQSGATIEGYVFDCTDAADVWDAAIRLIPKNEDNRVSVPCKDIQTLEFSGRDTAAGKSFDTWIKKYVEKKLAGEEASIYGDDDGA